MWTTPDYIHEPLYVICPISNPIRYKTRWKLYERFAQHVKQSGGVLVTVEAAYGERHHAMQAGETQHETPIYQRAPTKAAEYHKARAEEPHQYIRVRTNTELWVKENLINIGISRLPEDWKYVAWVDGDVMFTRPNWVGETIHQLQHYKVVQMFSECQDVGPRYGSLKPAKSFAHCYVKELGVPDPAAGGYYHQAPPKVPSVYWHPGFAWAARRDAFDELGGLIDYCVIGSADYHMAYALIGEVERTIHPGLSEGYRRHLLEWQRRAERHIRRNVGYVSGLLVHYWHGRKVDRRYSQRWRILLDNSFDPDLDLRRDWQGLYQLVDRGDDRSIGLRDGIMKYMRARNEDSIELDGVADET